MIFFNLLDPVKEYGCAPWPMVEKLIRKCLKENPQERPTSAQVFLNSKFVNILCKYAIHMYICIRFSNIFSEMHE